MNRTYTTPITLSTEFYNLSLNLGTASTRLCLTLKIVPVNTYEFPLTFAILKEKLPSVLRSECFNEDGLPFYQEVRSTEIGHLFEHILLEYLCISKIALGYKRATFSGETSWNWKKKPRGTFTITLDAGIREADIFPKAIERTIALLEIILRSNTAPLFLNKPKAYAAYGYLGGVKTKKKK